MSEKEQDVLESGDIEFHVWPAPGEGGVHGPQDVQRFFLVLRPMGGGVARRLVVGRKRLPEADEGRRRYWGFVDRVERGKGAAGRATRREEGDLEGPPPEPAGAGEYRLVSHEGHTDLVYRLDGDAPEEAPHEAFGVRREASYVLSVKNPEAASPPGVGLEPERRAELPRELQSLFGDHRWASAEPALLDHEGTEFLLVAERADAD